MKNYVLLKPSALATCLVTCLGVISACSSGGSGGGSDADNSDNGDNSLDLNGDDARRAVLADIGDNIVMPALRDFSGKAMELQTTLVAHAASADDATARAQAQQAWSTAMLSWQRNEVLQVGPAGPDTMLDATPGGEHLRREIYGFPVRNFCTIDQAASNEESVDELTGINIKGLGALEYLLFQEGINPDCPITDTEEALQGKRAEYALRIADYIVEVSSDLLVRWEPDGGNFIEQWKTAGIGSTVYSRPQDALDALSVALFYTEKDTKDDKVADPTGIGATALEPCIATSCPERLESRLSLSSGDNIQVNVQAFRDVFTGVNGGMGMNDLLRGIDRDDLADELITELDSSLTRLSEISPDFDTAVADIPSREQCVNATANRSGLSVCALHGDLKAAMDVFRGPIVASLSLATPNRAAGDND